MRFEKYVFICLNERVEDHPRGSCTRRGSQEVFDEFKQQIKDRKLRSKIRINRSGCLEVCEIGPGILVVPDNVWYGEISKEDVSVIIDEHLIGGKPVDRLLADFSLWNRGKASN